MWGSPVGLGAMPEGVAIAGNTLLFTTSILHPDKSGRLWGTQLTGWDREKAEIRFRLKIPTYLNLYPQELLPGYALAEVAPHGLKQHHPDVVCLDCSPEWPRVVGRVRKAFLDGA